MRIMGRERVDLRKHAHAPRLRWASGDQAAWNYLTITISRLTVTGQWVLDASKNPDGALICADMIDAIRLAHTWMAKSGRDWQPHPPAFKNISEPADPEWRREHDRLETEATRE